jgi:hypothetical protein
MQFNCNLKLYIFLEMFFDTNQINDTLLCSKCEGKVDIPKCLPCGEAICSLCETSIQVLENNKFDCLICIKKHEMPQDGLPIMKPLLKLLSIKPSKVSRGKAFDLLLKLLDEIEKKHSFIKFAIENSVDLVNTHCIDLRNDVQLTAEEAIQQINDLSSQIIVEIDEYEQKLIEYNKNNSKLLDEFNKNAKELETFHSVNTEYLKKYEVDEELVVKLNEEATNLIKKAELEIENLKETIFDGKAFKFEKNKEKVNKSIIGSTQVLNSKFCETYSIILSGKDQINDLISLCEFPAYQKWKLIYRATQDGFEASQFHSKCDDKLNTLVVIKSENGNVFGGYTEQSWSAIGYEEMTVEKPDANSFIFSLINLDNKPIKIKCSRNTAIACRLGNGPLFGGVSGCRDIFIIDKSNKNPTSCTSLGYSYVHPDYAFDSKEANSLLGGSIKFLVSEIEVYTKI